MGRKLELVNGGDDLEAKPALDQDSRVASEGRDVAGDGDGKRQAARRNFARLRFRPGARRVEQHAVETRELARGKRPAEEIARLGRDRPQAPRFARGPLKRVDRGGVQVRG